MTTDRNPVLYRNPELVFELLGYVLDHHPDPIPEPELLDTFAGDTDDRFNHRTVEQVLYDLRRFGALYRASGSARARRAPSYRITNLGTAWLERKLLRRPGKADTADLDAGEVLDLLIDLERALTGTIGTLGGNRPPEDTAALLRARELLDRLGVEL